MFEFAAIPYSFPQCFERSVLRAISRVVDITNDYRRIVAYGRAIYGARYFVFSVRMVPSFPPDLVTSSFNRKVAIFRRILSVVD